MIISLTLTRNARLLENSDPMSCLFKIKCKNYEFFDAWALVEITTMCGYVYWCLRHFEMGLDMTVSLQDKKEWKLWNRKCQRRMRRHFPLSILLSSQGLDMNWPFLITTEHSPMTSRVLELQRVCGRNMCVWLFKVFSVAWRCLSLRTAYLTREMHKKSSTLHNKWIQYIKMSQHFNSSLYFLLIPSTKC